MIQQRVLELDVDEHGVPIVPGADHVSVQGSGNWIIAYGPMLPGERGHPVYAFLWKHSPGVYLVTAEQSVISQIKPPGPAWEITAYVVTHDWLQWTCDGTEPDPEEGTRPFIGRPMWLPSKPPEDTSPVKPYNAGQGRMVTGIKPGISGTIGEWGDLRTMLEGS